MNMKSLLNWKTFLVIAFVAIAAAVVYSNYGAQEANEGIVIREYVKGAADATVVLTEHSEYCWLPLDEAAALASSATNRQVILALTK